MMSLQVKPVIDELALARFLGAGDDPRFSFSTTAKIERWVRTIRAVVQPSVYYCVKTIESVDQGAVYLEGGLQLRSRNVSKTLRLCEEAVCFIATIGDRIEGVTKRCMNSHRYSDAYIVDAMASAAIENVVEQFQQGMAAHYRAQGKAVTLRFSPGYCDWGLMDQKKIFGLFDPDQINVELLESCFILPRKSIVGLFGICTVTHGVSNCSYNPCTDCPKLDCETRRGDTLS
jgi:hypothetical protein